MGLGPPVCLECLVVGELTRRLPGHAWSCPICGSVKMKGSLLTFTSSFQHMLKTRSRLFTSEHPRLRTMIVEHTIRRKFMEYPDVMYEPNEYYRPWLEKYIGKQHVDWNWDLCRDNIELIVIEFSKKEYATLFELSWPQ